MSLDKYLLKNFSSNIKRSYIIWWEGYYVKKSAIELIYSAMG